MESPTESGAGPAKTKSRQTTRIRGGNACRGSWHCALAYKAAFCYTSRQSELGCTRGTWGIFYHLAKVETDRIYLFVTNTQPLRE